MSKPPPHPHNNNDFPTKPIHLTLDPKLSKLSRFSLYSSLTYFYIIGANETNNKFRLVRIHRRAIATGVHGRSVGGSVGGGSGGGGGVQPSGSSSSSKTPNYHTPSTPNKEKDKEKEINLTDVSTEDPKSYTSLEIDTLLKTFETLHNSSNQLKLLGRGYGIVGIVSFLSSYYVTLITKRECVGDIGGNMVYAVRGTEMVKICGVRRGEILTEVEREGMREKEMEEEEEEVEVDLQEGKVNGSCGGDGGSSPNPSPFISNPTTPLKSDKLYAQSKSPHNQTTTNTPNPTNTNSHSTTNNNKTKQKQQEQQQQQLTPYQSAHNTLSTFTSSVLKTINRKIGLSLTPTQSREIAELRYLGLYQFIDLSKNNFFFCYTYDLTRCVRDNVGMCSGSSSSNSSSSSSSSDGGGGEGMGVNVMYAWNYSQTRELHAITSHNNRVPSKNSNNNNSNNKNSNNNNSNNNNSNNNNCNNQWILPLIHGGYIQRTVEVAGRQISIILIARRSSFFAGTRYLKRGVSDRGRVANDVEHEQVLCDFCSGYNGNRNRVPSPNPNRHPSPLQKISSYLQVRGSIPIYWTQESSVTMPKPPIVLNRIDTTYNATKLHFSDLMTRYGGPVLVLDLVKQSEKREREVIVGREFRFAVEYLNSTMVCNQTEQEHTSDCDCDSERLKIRYVALDYSHISKSRNLNVNEALDEVAEWAVNKTGVFCAEPRFWIDQDGEGRAFPSSSSSSSSSSPPSSSSTSTSTSSQGLNRIKQTGVLRTNCIDCLDRTNVAQFSIGVYALRLQLVVMGIHKCLWDLKVNAISGSSSGSEGSNANASSKSNASSRDINKDRTRSMMNSSSTSTSKMKVDRSKMGSMDNDNRTTSTSTSNNESDRDRDRDSERYGGQGECSIVKVLMTMYGTIGDQLSLQYGGSEAHKKVTTLNHDNYNIGSGSGGGSGSGNGKNNGKNNNNNNNNNTLQTHLAGGGVHKEFLTSIRRYYSNTFTDRLKQDAINLFLGYYKPWESSQGIGGKMLWELENDYYLHNFHVQTGCFGDKVEGEEEEGGDEKGDDEKGDDEKGDEKGEDGLMRTPLKEGAISSNASTSAPAATTTTTTTLTPATPTTTTTTISTALVTHSSSASSSLSVSSALEKKEKEKVRQNCRRQNDLLSNWWREALKTHLERQAFTFAFTSTSPVTDTDTDTDTKTIATLSRTTQREDTNTNTNNNDSSDDKSEDEDSASNSQVQAQTQFQDRYQRTYKLEKLTQFDKYFAHAWAMPSRLSGGFFYVDESSLLDEEIGIISNDDDDDDDDDDNDDDDNGDGGDYYVKGIVDVKGVGVGSGSGKESRNLKSMDDALKPKISTVLDVSSFNNINININNNNNLTEGVVRTEMETERETPVINKLLHNLYTAKTVLKGRQRRYNQGNAQRSNININSNSNNDENRGVSGGVRVGEDGHIKESEKETETETELRHVFIGDSDSSNTHTTNSNSNSNTHVNEVGISEEYKTYVRNAHNPSIFQTSHSHLAENEFKDALKECNLNAWNVNGIRRMAESGFISKTVILHERAHEHEHEHERECIRSEYEGLDANIEAWRIDAVVNESIDVKTNSFNRSIGIGIGIGIDRNHDRNHDRDRDTINNEDEDADEIIKLHLKATNFFSTIVEKTIKTKFNNMQKQRAVYTKRLDHYSISTMPSISSDNDNHNHGICITDNESMNLYMSCFDEGGVLGDGCFRSFIGFDAVDGYADSYAGGDSVGIERKGGGSGGVRASNDETKCTDKSISIKGKRQQHANKNIAPREGFDQINDDLFARKANKYMVFNGVGMEDWKGERMGGNGHGHGYGHGYGYGHEYGNERGGRR